MTERKDYAKEHFLRHADRAGIDITWENVTKFRGSGRNTDDNEFMDAIAKVLNISGAIVMVMYPQGFATYFEKGSVDDLTSHDPDMNLFFHKVRKVE